jgi:hypothetical protein
VGGIRRDRSYTSPLHTALFCALRAITRGSVSTSLDDAWRGGQDGHRREHCRESTANGWSRQTNDPGAESVSGAAPLRSVPTFTQPSDMMISRVCERSSPRRPPPTRSTRRARRR